ncbi:MAG: ASCH domain-containing protein [Gammaproteobacteria bacterium]|nr:ASCH domain-containing protein [Gammaproteobacteria bacterium]
MDNKIKLFFQKYLDSLPASHPHQHERVTSGYFCADEERADNCSDLIFKGVKTATCSMQYWYDHESESLPKTGHLHVVTNWQGDPTSIIETIEVQECKFHAVNEEFASAEGEGDRSLNFWRKTHWEFFSNECKDINIIPSEEMMLILERFRIVYQ